MNSIDSNRWYQNPAVVFPWSLVLSLVVALIILNFPIADFELSFSRETVEVAQGNEELLLLSVNVKNGYEKVVSLSPVEDYEGINLELSRDSLKKGGYSRLRIQISPDTSIATKKIKIRGVGTDGKSRTIDLIVNIKPADWQPLEPNQQDIDLLRDEGWKELVNIIPYDDLSYTDLFGGIEATIFYAYNAPWKIENVKGSAAWESAIAVHKQRYQSEVRSKYLFFDSASLARAVDFWSDLQTQMDIDLNTLIEARLLSEVEGKQPTYFMWKKESIVDVLYPEPFLINGKPQLVFQTVGNDSIHALLRRSFDEKWERAIAVGVIE